MTATNTTKETSPAAADLAPTGRLRVGINFGNPLLASRTPEGEPAGVAVDLARELGRYIGVPIDIVPYESAGAMAGAAVSQAWDAAFLAVDPDRAEEIAFTDPYLMIGTSCLVPADSTLQHVGEVDAEGIRIAVSRRSAYDLFLSREIRHATLLRAANAEASRVQFLHERLDALAGLKPWLIAVASTLPGSRVLDGQFTAVRQAIGTPAPRAAGIRHVRAFLHDSKASGLVAAAVARHRLEGVEVV